MAPMILAQAIRFNSGARGDDSFLAVFATASVWVGVFAALIIFIVNVMFAGAVYADASRFEDSGRSKLFFVGPFCWAFWVLIAGPFGAAVYWLMHHSALRSDASEPAPEILRPMKKVCAKCGGPMELSRNAPICHGCESRETFRRADKS